MESELFTSLFSISKEAGFACELALHLLALVVFDGSLLAFDVLIVVLNIDTPCLTGLVRGVS
jgi:hypothetical protein